MVDGYEGEKGAVVAGSRGYFLKVRIRIQQDGIIKKERNVQKTARLKRPTNPPLVLAFLLQTYWQLDAIFFLRQESADKDSPEQKPLRDPL